MNSSISIRSMLVKSGFAVLLAGALYMGDISGAEARSRRGWAYAGAGFLAGAIVGSAIAGSRGYYGPGYGYYGPSYYYGPTYYAPPPVYVAPSPVYVQPEPLYYAPAPRYIGPRAGGCWVETDKDRGFGYYRC